MKKIILFGICVLTIMTSRAAGNRPNSLHGIIIQGDTLIGEYITPLDGNINLLSAGLSLGTQGIGIETQIPLVRRWQLRAGATILPIKISQDYMAFPSRSVVTNFNVSVAKLHAFADWQLFPSSSHSILQKFVLSGGGAYFISAKGTAKMKLKDPYYYGDIELSQDEVGELNVASNWNGFAPYIGLGLNRFKIANQIGLDVAAGVFYLSSPSVQITGTNMLSDNIQNQAQLQRNLDKYYRWMPSIQFVFNYTLKN